MIRSLNGSWLQGAPLANCPFRDNLDVAVDPNRNNNFDYVIRDNPKVSANEPSDYYCPFTAHTRKTAPRNLDPFFKPKYLESGSIVRGGLPYGPEVRRLRLPWFHGLNLCCPSGLGYRPGTMGCGKRQARSETWAPVQLLHVELRLRVRPPDCWICG